ncbi:SRPBCC domain-containing protein [Aliifodinibius sp. S!AR15-10]|uniref:SRPBCC family protein n=1 Tax=Aliifodinibius sp. S!AR15-10 TaxID=2950437 RepID=UPI002858244E|nr:SRPBCC domain-containing protein [Aliifodinibius sp. S!AR15-10]MDR8391380.1 SRPBCC domain-containing protein [Aliifodinibius sp. S!AR15-10]
MKNNILTDFSVDKENNTVKVKREFAAPKKHVWAAWTEPELLDQWWAPKPWKSRTKSMDFKEGGRRLYAMVGPEGEEHWCLADYKSITSEMHFAYRDGFCDSSGNISQDMPRSDWSVEFTELNGLTTVDVEITYETLSDLEKVIEMGFREGFTATLEELAEVLPAMKQ